MKYVAVYTSKEAKRAAYDAAISMILTDDHYSRYPETVDGSPCGTGLVKAIRDGSTWSHFDVVGRKVENLLHLSDDEVVKIIAEIGKVTWTSCRGNQITYDFTARAGAVVVTINSRRHGIPCRRMAPHEPSEVLEYTTQEPQWSVWDTVDDHNK